MEEIPASMEPLPEGGIEPTEPEGGSTKWWVWALIGIGALVAVLFIVGLFNQQGETAPAPPSTDDSWTRVKTSGVLRVGTSADYAPFEYYNDQLAIDGFDAALIREVGNKLGVLTEISDFAFPSLADAVRIGQIDVAIAALSITPEREAVADFSNIYYVGEDGVLANEDSSIEEVSSAADLAGKRVGVQKVSVYEAWAQSNLVDTGIIPQQNLIAYGKADQIVSDLESNALDVGLMDFKPAVDFSENRGVKVAGKGLNQQRFAIAAKQGATELISRINQALVELQNEGVLARLSQEYLDLTPDEIIPPPTPAPTPDACIDASKVVRDINLDDEDLTDLPVLEPGERFQKGWRLRNTGNCTWNTAYFAKYIRGNTAAAEMGGQPTSIVRGVNPGQTYDLWVDLQAPESPGEYVAYWQMHNDAQIAFGETFVVGVEVPGSIPEPTATLAATAVPTATEPEPTLPIELTETQETPEPTETPVPGAEIMDILWEWVSLQEADPPSQSAVADPESYNLVLFPDEMFEVKADCNSLTGQYEITETELVLEIEPYTKVACPEGSLSENYIDLLGEVNEWELVEVEGEEDEQLFLGYGPGVSTEDIMGFSNEGPAPTPTP